MAGEKCDFDKTFSFSPLPSKKLLFLQDKDTLALFMKWSMLGRLSAQSYSFDQTFYPYNSERFAMSFFRDPDVVSSLSKEPKAGAWVPLDKPVMCVDVEPVPCTQVSMELFDPIYSCGILRPSGHVVKCFHDVYPDHDELRRMLQEEDSEHYYVVGREERGEFLFRIFEHLCFGGELCQYEDTIDPYISTTKQIYKDLISVQKDPVTKKISVVSTVLRVWAYVVNFAFSLDPVHCSTMLSIWAGAALYFSKLRLRRSVIMDESERCYPGRREEMQTFAYLIVDPFKRHVTLFYHCYGIGVFT